jgi:hypothetical protein
MVGVNVKVGVSVSVGVKVMVGVKVSVGVDVNVAVGVSVHEAAVDVSALEVAVACASGESRLHDVIKTIAIKNSEYFFISTPKT